MKRRYNIFICLVLIILINHLNTSLAFAQKENPIKKSTLWRIKGNGLEKASYLFGTVHILDSAYFYIDDTVIEQLKKCDKVVFETNITEQDYQNRSLMFSMMKNDSLENLLGVEKYTRIKSFFKEEFNFPLEAVKRMKPFYVASVIDALSMTKNSKSYEVELIKLAGKNEIEIDGISTLEKENEILERMNYDTQIKILESSINEYQNGVAIKRKNDIMNLYRKGDIEGILGKMHESIGEDEEIYEIMFPQRHKSWLPLMIKKMKENSCFFAVGVGHLAGDEGLIRHLQEKGYKVKPVKMDFWFHD